MQSRVVRRQVWVFVVSLAGCLSAVAQDCPLAGAAGPLPWQWRPASSDHLSFRGIARFDAVGTGAHPMVYVAPGLAGFLANVLVHAVVENVERQREKDRIQAQADDVLKPYGAVIGAFTQAELRQRALQWLPPAADADSAPAAWAIDAAPVFAFVPDSAAVELDARILVDPLGTGTGAVAHQRQVSIRVIGAAVDASDREAYWIADDGEHLRSTSARLLAESIQLAMQEAAVSEVRSDTDPPFRTVRYLEGDVERMERAQVLAERCDRLVIRTLRGGLMSVPAKPAARRPPSSAASATEAAPVAEAVPDAACRCAAF